MSSGRTGLILRQWVERDGCTVTAYQAESYELPSVMTSVTDKVRVFVFENEWRAMLCEARMSTYKKSREKYWKRYFFRHVNPPEPKVSFNLWLLLRPDVLLPILAILIILGVYLR